MAPPEFIPFGGDEVAPFDPESAEIVVLPIPYERDASYGTGSQDGPFHMLQASVQLERIDEETFTAWGDLKIRTDFPLMPTGTPESAMIEIQSAASRLLSEGRRVLCLGGDHSISIGPILAAAKAVPELGLLWIDAHLDLRDTWNGSRYNHACVMRRVIEESGIPVIPVGTRSVAPEELAAAEHHRIQPVYAHAIDPLDSSWIRRVVDALPEHVYLSIDLDGLDPSVVPGTGTPEPGGLSYRQVVSLIAAVGQHRTVIAADLTELAKIPGSQVSEYTAARLAAKIFVHCFTP